jgi:hypothetical protein
MYSLDVLVAAVAGYWFVRTASWPLWRRVVPVAVVAPIAIWLSYTTCFVCGGLILGFALAAWRSGTGSANRLVVGALAVAVCGSFAVLALGPAAAQRTQELSSFWIAMFPDYSRPWWVPVWTVAQVFEVGRYNLLPYGQVLIPFVAVGATAVLRREHGTGHVVVLLAPIGLALVASFLHRYPFGGCRLEAFAAPALMVLAGAGVDVAWRAVRPRWLVVVLVSLLVAPPIGLAVYRVAVPWERPGAAGATAYVLEHRRPDEVVFVNHWEYQYYLRGIPDHLRRGHEPPAPADLAPGRYWVIHTSSPRVAMYPYPVPEGWVVAESRWYPLTGVFRLERTSPTRPDLLR